MVSSSCEEEEVFPTRSVWHEKVLRVGTIKKFVGQCGSYFGICAGVYFASGRVVFEKETDLEVDEERDL